MTKNVKQALVDFVHQLPEECSWDDVMQLAYVRQKIERGLQDEEEGRLVSHDEVFEEFKQ